MELTPFRNYSDALIPLPPLVPKRESAPAPAAPSFREEIQNRIDTENPSPTTGSLTPPVNTPGLFNPPPPIQPFGTTPETTGKSEELMQACRDIEGFMLGLLLKDLGKDFAGGSLFSQTYESSVYKDMFFQELAQSIGNTPPGIGIADRLYNDIILNSGDSIDQLI